MDRAPFRNDLTKDAPDGDAYWFKTADDVRLRIGGWTSGTDGTVLLFTGRAEYIERYSQVAVDLAASGLSTVGIDWRGQGLSDRLASDRRLGHVVRFTDYQRDVDALTNALHELEYPKPYFLLAHSMGGAIGLRALTRGLPVEAAVFSAPMWGIQMSPLVKPFARLITGTARSLGLGLNYSPTTDQETYFTRQPFEGNDLTQDPEAYAVFQNQVRSETGFNLGGPSMHWLDEALSEIQDLGKTASVPCPTLAFVGTEEKVVIRENVISLTANWPNARAEVLPGSRHEPMMEIPEIRDVIMHKTVAHFSKPPNL